MVFRVVDKTSGAILAERAERAASFCARLTGLIARRHLPPGEGLHLAPCRSIHTFFMHFSIDVLFLSSDDVVLRALHSVPPWRVSRIFWRALSALELPAGTLLRSGTREGHRIRFDKANLVGHQRPLC